MRTLSLCYRSIKISPKKILHGVLNSGFPQPDFFPQENLAVVFNPGFPQPDYFPSRKFGSGFPIN
jgi:hypothetical protein